MEPEQSRQPAPVGRHQPVSPDQVAQHDLDQVRVEVGDEVRNASAETSTFSRSSPVRSPALQLTGRAGPSSLAPPDGAHQSVRAYVTDVLRLRPDDFDPDLPEIDFTTLAEAV
ncbi:hypothetical protein [Nonomuraea sp. NPDC023979]|uniref:hypothetical protein n=1 Tax=Nonomuraea sp. NPDC023979 TaxID=3154796 RepID=UPI0034011DF1